MRCKPLGSTCVRKRVFILPIDDDDRHADRHRLVRQHLIELLGHLARGGQDPGLQGGIIAESLINLPQQFATTERGRARVLLALDAQVPALPPGCTRVSALLENRTWPQRRPRRAIDL